MGKKRNQGEASKAKAAPTAEAVNKTNTEKIPVEAPENSGETLQPKAIETPEIIEKETIIVSEPPVANVKIDEPTVIIQRNEKKVEVSMPDQSKEEEFETTDPTKLKKVTGKKRNLHGVIYVGIKK